MADSTARVATSGAASRNAVLLGKCGRRYLRTRAGEQAVIERETIGFRHDGDRWVAVHEHLSPHPGLAA